MNFLEIDILFQKAQPTPGYAPGHYRKDRFGRLIKRSEFGRLSAFGWQAYFPFPNMPLEEGEPMHWESLRELGR